MLISEVNNFNLWRWNAGVTALPIGRTEAQALADAAQGSGGAIIGQIGERGAAEDSEALAAQQAKANALKERTKG